MKKNKLSSKLYLKKERIANLDLVMGGRSMDTKLDCIQESINCDPSCECSNPGINCNVIADIDTGVG